MTTGVHERGKGEKQDNRQINDEILLLKITPTAILGLITI